jgi:hypothetical protein
VLADTSAVTLYQPRRSPFKRRKRIGEEPEGAPEELPLDNKDQPAE